MRLGSRTTERKELWDPWLLMEHDGLAIRIDASLFPVCRREGSDLEVEGEGGRWDAPGIA